MDHDTVSCLNRFLEDREHLPVPGNALLVFHGGKEIFRRYTGASEKDTLYRVYSMTKPVTVTAAMQLYEKGLFALDDPLYRYMPEFEKMTVWDREQGKAVPAGKPVLIRDLFRMTAGFTYEGDYDEVPRRALALRERMNQAYHGESYTTREYIRRYAAVPLAFEPGTHWQYSLCHDVLGALIEVLSGQTLGEYMAEHIFAPLGMTHTFFRCPEELRPLIAPADESAEQDAKYGLQSRYESGGGGLLSTLDDYMTFARALTNMGESQNGVRLLKQETVDLIRQDQLDDRTRPDFNWDYLHGYTYGLGMRVMTAPGTDGIPGSKGEFGWCGVLGTWVLMDPANGLTCVYMHQRYPNLEKYVQLSLRPLIYRLIGEDGL